MGHRSCYPRSLKRIHSFLNKMWSDRKSPIFTIKIYLWNFTLYIGIYILMFCSCNKYSFKFCVLSRVCLFPLHLTLPQPLSCYLLRFSIKCTKTIPQTDIESLLIWACTGTSTLYIKNIENWFDMVEKCVICFVLVVCLFCCKNNLQYTIYV